MQTQTSTQTPQRRRRTPQERAALDGEALARAAGNQGMMNYSTIYEGFAAKGIPASEIQPRVNVFTFAAWRALNRTVRRGEHGVRVVVFVPTTEQSDDGKAKQGRLVRSTTVFHISQTDPLFAK